MANAREIQSRIKTRPGYHEDHQCHVHDFLFKMRKPKRYWRIQSHIFIICRLLLPESCVIFRISSILFFSVRHLVPQQERKTGIIVVTGDKGMAGAYNHNITKLTDEFMEKNSGLSQAVCTWNGRPSVL